MLLDVLKLRCLAKRRYIPIQHPQPFVQLRVAAPDVSDIALEVLDVDRVEADDGGVKADVGFGDGGAKIVG